MGGTWKKDPTSWRTTPRPRGWNSRIRPYVIDRDGGRCTWVESLPDGGHWSMEDHPDRCTAPGVDVDHMGEPDDHRLEMLRLLCEMHHDKRSSAQAAAARRQSVVPRKRPEPKHPGMR